MRPIILEESTDRLTSLALTALEQKSCHKETEIKLLSAEIPFPWCIFHDGARSEIAGGEFSWPKHAGWRHTHTHTGGWEIVG